MNIAYATLLPLGIEEPDRFRRPPLAAGYLASYLDAYRQGKDSHDVVDSVELAELPNPEVIASRLLRTNPRVVALSVYVWNHKEVAEVSRKIRSLEPDVKVVLGGPEVAYTPATAFKEFDADWVCTGEGEIPFLNLVNMLERSPGSQSLLPGFLHRTHAEISDFRPSNPLVQTLDDIPSPYLSGKIDIAAGGWIDLETTRGCPYRCRFCLYGKTLDSLRHFSLERVEAEIAHAIGRGAADIYLMDPTFNYPRERCMSICRLLADLNKEQLVRFSAEVRAELMDETMADAFQKAGVRFLEVGLQSSNRDTLRIMKRGLAVTRFVQGCKMLNERGIHVDIGVIVGLPGDDEDTIRRTADFVLENGLGHLNIYRLQVLPGSEYNKLAGQLGVEFYPDPPYFVRRTPNLSEERIVHLTDCLRALASQANAAYTQKLAASSNQGLRSKEPGSHSLSLKAGDVSLPKHSFRKKSTQTHDSGLAAKSIMTQKFRQKEVQTLTLDSAHDSLGRRSFTQKTPQLLVAESADDLSGGYRSGQKEFQSTPLTKVKEPF